MSSTTDNSSKNTNPLNLMAKRLGVFYQQPTSTTVDYTEGIKNERSLMARRMGLLYNGSSVDSKTLDSSTVNTTSDTSSTTLEGIDNQQAMLEFNGGHLQQERMIYDKRRSLDRAVLYSYQAADVKKVDAASTDKPIRALINPNKLKQDYDDKILSIGYEYGYTIGDVFTWVGTNTYWIIYDQNLTELAYFRGDIRRCSYKIAIPTVDDDGNTVGKDIYAAIIGPQQSNIQTVTYNGISHDMLNNTITLIVPKTTETISFFDRRTVNNGVVYDKFLLRSLSESDIPWAKYHVEDADWISSPGVIYVSALEVKDAEGTTDETTGLVTADTSTAITEEVSDYNDDTVEEAITGETFIKPTIQYTYNYTGTTSGTFIIGGNKSPVEVIEQDSTHIILKWTHTYSGQFNLIYRVTTKDSMTGATTNTDITKVIVAESLF